MLQLLHRALSGNPVLTLLLCVAASEALALHWGLARVRGSGLGGPAWALASVALLAANVLVLRTLRAHAWRSGFLYRLSRGYLIASLGALFSGPPLAVVLALAWLGADAAPRTAELLFGTGGAAALGAGFGTIFWGWLVGARRLAIEEVELAVSGLPAGLHGLRIAHLSDLHIGKQLQAPELRRFVEAVNALAPDLVVLTGDIFDYHRQFIEEGCGELAKLSARHGVVAVLGNHDHYTGADAVSAALRSLTPITLLRDEHTTLEIRGEALFVVGLDDPVREWARRNARSAVLPELASAGSPGAFRLLLVHRPSYFGQAVELGLPLMLAGHTHGGQITLPGPARHWNVSRLIAPWTRGRFAQGDSVLYVNRGLGVVGPPVRLNCTREIALLTLVPRG